jgi:hypothetical protein
MGEAVAKVIGIPDGEDLRLGFQAAKGTRVNDAIAVASVLATVGMGYFRIAAAA